MNAIYKGKLYSVGDNMNVVELTNPETDATLTVPWGDPELIVDPTDDQVFALVPDEETGGLIRLKTEEYEYTPKEKEAAGIIDLLCPVIAAEAGVHISPKLFKRLTLRLAELLPDPVEDRMFENEARCDAESSG